MCRIVHLSPTKLLLLVTLSLFMPGLNGCAVTNAVRDSSWLAPVPLEKNVERHVFPVSHGEDVIGRLALLKLEKGDTLPDVARHFGLGITALTAANPGVDTWVPEAGDRITLPLSFILPDVPRKGIVVNLASMRLFQYREEGASLVVTTYPVGVGTKERPTPTGQMQVKRKATRPTWYVPASIAEDHRKKGDPLPTAVPPGPMNPLGECALYLSKAGYLIHGTNKPASIGLTATNGCLRLYPENVEILCRETPVNTPVAIVNQPYLIGQRDGVLYMEAHAPLEDTGSCELEKIYATLRNIEKASGLAIDWQKVREVQAEARGIPVPVFTFNQAAEKVTAKAIEVEHPATLYGRPETPELKLGAWHVLAADVRDKLEALRTAAIINHQGPPIPARVVSRSNGYRVIAGPFNDVKEAREVVKRLKIDLDMDAILVEPVTEVES